eukprot:1161899-Pelagomonas_calceolata.AAC.5
MGWQLCIQTQILETGKQQFACLRTRAIQHGKREIGSKEPLVPSTAKLRDKRASGYLESGESGDLEGHWKHLASEPGVGSVSMTRLVVTSLWAYMTEWA